MDFSGGGDGELSEDRSVSRQWTLGNSPQSRLIAKQRRFNHRAIPAVAALIRPIAGKVLMLDPALSAGDDNTAMKQQVSDGRGGSTNCQASGAATNDGHPEHTFAWDTTR